MKEGLRCWLTLTVDVAGLGPILSTPGVVGWRERRVRILVNLNGRVDFWVYGACVNGRRCGSGLSGVKVNWVV